MYDNLVCATAWYVPQIVACETLSRETRHLVRRLGMSDSEVCTTSCRETRGPERQGHFALSSGASSSERHTKTASASTAAAGQPAASPMEADGAWLQQLPVTRHVDWVPLVAFLVADQSISAHSSGRLESHYRGM